MKRLRSLGLGLGVTAVALTAFGGAAACGDSFDNACEKTHTCAPRHNGEGGDAGSSSPVSEGGGGDQVDSSGGQAHGDDSAGQPATDGGQPTGSTSDGGGSGAPAEASGPPEGAFAWYVATKDDVTTVSATLADGNDFIKSYWKKTDVSATALQPDADGGNDATAIKLINAGMGDHSMRHPLLSSSSYAPKTLRIRAKMGTWRYLWLGGPANPLIANSLEPYAVFDLLDGVIMAPYAATAKIAPEKDLWYTCEITAVTGPEFWFGVSNVAKRDGGGPQSTEPVMWVQSAEVEQVTVGAWHDRISGRDFTDKTGKWRWIASSPEFSGLPVLEATQGAAPKLEAGGPEEWSFLHDGSGGSFVILHEQARPNKSFGSSFGTDYSGAQGIRFGVASTDAKTWEWSANNAAGEAVFALRGGTTEGANWHAGSYAAAATPAAQLFENGFSVGVAEQTAEPSASAPASPLMLGASEHSPTQRVHELLVYDRALSSKDVERLESYFAKKLPK